MAAEQIEIASFDLQTKQAKAQVTALLQELRALEAQEKELIKTGKDTAAIDAKVAQTKEKLTRVISQQTTTEKGAIAQRKAAIRVARELAEAAKRAAGETERLNNSTGKSAAFFARSLGGAKNLTSALARGGAGLANLVGGFGLGGVALGLFSNVTDKVTSSLIEYFTASNAAAESQARFKENTNSAIDSIVSETRANNSLFAELRSGETTSKRKIEIVKQLNEQYPSIIGNTDLLTASETKLKEIQEQANAGIRARILIKAQEAQASQIVSEIAKRTVEAEQEVNAILLERQSSSNEKERTESRIRQDIEALQRRKDLTEQDKLYLKALQDEQIALAKRRQGEAEGLRKSIQSSKGIDGLKRELGGLASAYKEVDRVLSGVDFQSSLFQDGGKDAKESGKAIAQVQDELSGSLADYRSELSKLNKELETQTKLQDQDKIDALGVSIRFYTEKVKESEEALKKATEANVPYIASVNQLRKALAENQRLLDEQPQDADKIRIYTAEIAKLEKELKNLEGAIKILQDPFLPTGANQQNIRAAQAQFDVARLAIEDLALARNSALLKIQQEENAAIAAFGSSEEKRQEIAQQFAARRKLLDIQTQSQVLQARIEAAEKELKLTEETGEAELEKLTAQRSEIVELQRQLAELQGQQYTVSLEVDGEKTKKSIKDTVLQIADLTQQVSEQVIDFVSSRNQAAIATADAAISKQEQVLNKLLENEETANVEQVRLEQERLEKLNQEREKAKEREAAIAQVQIAINLALAVARAAAEGGGIASAATIGIALAAAIFGFLKAKQAATQAFADGTMNVRRAKGEKAGRDTVHAMLDEGESVFSKSKTKQYNPALKAIFDGSVSADVINGFVRGEHVSDGGEPVAKYSVSLSRKASAEDSVKYIVLAPEGGGSEKLLAQAIEKMPRQHIKGGEIYTVVQTKSSKIENQRKRAKGY